MKDFFDGDGCGCLITIYVFIGILYVIMKATGGGESYSGSTPYNMNSDTVLFTNPNPRVLPPSYNTSSPLKYLRLQQEQRLSSAGRSSHSNAYDEGYDNGYDDGQRDGINGHYREYSYDDSNSYANYAEERYKEGYESGYEDGYYYGHKKYEEEEEGY